MKWKLLLFVVFLYNLIFDCNYYPLLFRTSPSSKLYCNFSVFCWSLINIRNYFIHGGMYAPILSSHVWHLRERLIQRSGGLEYMNFWKGGFTALSELFFFIKKLCKRSASQCELVPVNMKDDEGVPAPIFLVLPRSVVVKLICWPISAILFKFYRDWL